VVLADVLVYKVHKELPEEERVQELQEHKE
jgi:hypothetical protein